MTGAEKCVLFAIPPATIGPIVRKTPCNDVNSCKLKDKHPELLTEIRTLQRELKELEQKYAKVKSDHEVFTASRQRAKSSFFTSTRPRLRRQNPMKYMNRSPLGRDLMSLQRALRNKVPLKEIAWFNCRVQTWNCWSSPFAVNWNERLHENVTITLFAFYRCLCCSIYILEFDMLRLCCYLLRFFLNSFKKMPGVDFVYIEILSFTIPWWGFQLHSYKVYLWYCEGSVSIQ